MKRYLLVALAAVAVLLTAYPTLRNSRVGSCLAYAWAGWRAVATDRQERFLGKVSADTARCRGGATAVSWSATPWLDWPQYYSAGGKESRYSGLAENFGFLSPNHRGINGALLDLEYQRIELLKFNLFDNSGTYEAYARAFSDPAAAFARSWPQMRLAKEHPLFVSAGGDGPHRCSGDIIRFRTLTGICNDLLNPLMGSTGQPFARNTEFEATFPELAPDEISKNRHGDRVGLLKPDPQVVSRKLLSRGESRCGQPARQDPSSSERACDYRKANHLNLLAAFWIQFMTHDWFAHLQEGRNGSELMPMGCRSRRDGSTERRLTAKEINALGCRPHDRIDKSLISDDTPPPTFMDKDNNRRLARAPRTTANNVTAWWDASQIYGYDQNSLQRVKREPADPAKLLLEPADGESLPAPGYLPILHKSDPQNPQWAGQEAVAFPDNWNIGLSFFHNVFAREHNLFVEAFRRHAAEYPNADSGLRHPKRPHQVIANEDITGDELFEIARLVVSAEIAKIHTIEWTTQLLYNEPLYLAMNANWSGLLREYPRVSGALARVLHRLAGSASADRATTWYSAFAAGPGILGLGNDRPDVNGGVNHFGSPFNFPEEFINAYRLHPMVPDVIELRDLESDPDAIAARVPVIATLRGKAAGAMRRHGIAAWALSLGRQRIGALTLRNHPRFLQDLEMPRLAGKVDIAALDILRDRERGIPRYNEFRRQYGLKQLTSFDDFIDPRLPTDSPERAEQEAAVSLLREIYGQHECDAKKIITRAQTNDDGSPINDCLGRPDGSLVDNIEDVDAHVGWLAEFVRPHGFAISETQFQVFILNASRRLFSDRFLTSSFRPEFYTHFGIRWVNDSGPDGKIMETVESNGHEAEVSPLKRVLLRTIPELKNELGPVINVFDPWARDRGEYYSLEWKPRPGAEKDPAFRD